MSKPEITFIPETHTYLNKYGKELISVSTLIGLYEPEFDKDGEIIKRCAQKKGITVAQMQKEWDKIRDDACDRGKSFHSQAEHWVKTGKVKKGDYQDVVKQLTKYPFKGKLKSETIVFSNKMNIAGTIDLVDEYGDCLLDVYDFKTNKELKKKSFFNKDKGGYQCMLDPLSHLQDCNYIHYSLQIQIYSLILEEMGYWVNDRTILYINPKTRLIEVHPVLPLRKEAIQMIEHYNQLMSW